MPNIKSIISSHNKSVLKDQSDYRIYHSIRMLSIQLFHLTRKLCKKVVRTLNYNATLNRQNLNDPEVEI